MIINQDLLNQKINSLNTFIELNKNQVNKFNDILTKLSDWELFRINPFRFTKEHGLNQTETLNIFICGAKIGLFDFEWNLLCPFCGMVVNHHKSIGELNVENFHCVLCDVYVNIDLNDFVKVVFTINQKYAKININPFENFQSYIKYNFTEDYKWQEKSIYPFESAGFKAFNIVEPGETLKIDFESRPNELYRLCSPDNNDLIRIQFNDKISKIHKILDIDILAAGFSQNTYSIPAGKVTLNLNNHLGWSTGMILSLINQEKIVEMFENDPSKFDPYVSGKILLNNQIFKDLFKIQTLPHDFSVKISDITILFTDLKGSTELYDSVGDVSAYNLVQQHFNLLKDATRKNGGAIVKTIGDAVMASFSKPDDGLYAAFEMIDRISKMNREKKTKDPEISIKVGLHCGTALAVTANEVLDFFGQTVNIAARVQGLAQAGEIWISDSLLKNNEIKNILELNNREVEEYSAILKGIKEPTIVYRILDQA